MYKIVKKIPICVGGETRKRQNALKLNEKLREIKHPFAIQIPQIISTERVVKRKQIRIFLNFSGEEFCFIWIVKMGRKFSLCSTASWVHEPGRIVDLLVELC